MTAETIATTPGIVAEDVRVELGGREVVRGVSLEVHPGEIVTLVGPNGHPWIDGLAWLPEPSSLILLVVGALPVLRRRR